MVKVEYEQAIILALDSARQTTRLHCFDCWLSLTIGMDLNASITHQYVMVCAVPARSCYCCSGSCATGLQTKKPLLSQAAWEHEQRSKCAHEGAPDEVYRQ